MATTVQVIDLAQEAAFRLGVLNVDPPLRRVSTGETLQPRVMQVLIALVRADGAVVTRDQLIESCWDGRIVGEDSITRVLVRLRKLAEERGQGSFRIETIAKVGYRLVVTPDAGEPSAVSGETIAPTRPFSIWLILGCAVLIGVAATLAWFMPRTLAAAGPLYSISVQPFTAQHGTSPFGDELSTALSAAQVPTAGGRVRLALAGSVADRDGITRVNVRLLDQGGQEALWSGAFEIPSALPNSQADLAIQISSTINCIVQGANDTSAPLEPAILSLYARACHLTRSGEFLRGFEAARQLIARRPDFTGGWWAKGYTLAVQNIADPERFAGRKEGLEAAERLIALRPGAQDGYVFKAQMLPSEAAIEREQLLRHAAALPPFRADLAAAALGDFLLQTGRASEALPFYRRAVERNPEEPLFLARLFMAADLTGADDVADDALRRLAKLSFLFNTNERFRRAMWHRNWGEAAKLPLYSRKDLADAARSVFRALASGDATRKAAAARQLAALPEDCCLLQRLYLTTALGDNDRAFALLERYDPMLSPGRLPGLPAPLLFDPNLRGLWYDARFPAFVERHGFITYWRTTRSRPDICRDRQPPDFCRLLD